MDINLQGANGVDLGKTILDAFPASKVIILTMYNQPKLLDEACNASLTARVMRFGYRPQR